MLPYGHQNYSTWITWHLRDMQHPPATAKGDLLARSHVCHHSDDAAAVSGDMFAEQTCIKQGKGVGGMKGISTNPEQVAVWMQCFSICSHLSKSLDEMHDDAEELEKTMKPNRHKEEGMRVLWENSHPLTTETATIGQDMSTLFSSSLPGGFHAPISNKVVTMKFKTKGVKDNEKIIRDLVALFAWLLVVGSKTRTELSTFFYYKLGPVPASIINEYGCLRNSNKSVIAQCLGIVPNLHPPDVVLVDTSQLISHVVWPSSGAVADLAASLGRRLDSYITQTFVIFDRYEQVSAKDHERQRRAGETSTEYQLSLT